MYKKLKTVPIQLSSETGRTFEIMLPINYEVIFNQIKTKNSEDHMILTIFINKYLELHDFDKKWYQHLANSGRVPTDELFDLLKIFDKMNNYFFILGVSSFEELGQMYAVKNHLTIQKKKFNAKTSAKFEQLGRSVYEHFEGFFADGRFYGLKKNNEKR